MIIVNLNQFGLVPHKFCHREELMAVYKVACEILDDTDEETLKQILVEWESALIWRSLDAAPVDEEWYYRALLVICIRGLRGEITPEFYSSAK